MSILRLSLYKTKMAFGGIGILLVVLLVFGFVFSLVSEITQIKAPEAIPFAVVDEDNSPQSKALVRAFAEENGLEMAVLTEDAAILALSYGDAEGMLKIEKSYGDKITRETKMLPLAFYAAPSSVSAEALREIVSGTVLSQAAFERGMLHAGEKQEAYRAIFDSLEVKVPFTAQYNNSDMQAKDSFLFEDIQAMTYGFFMFSLIMVLFSAARRLGETSSRAVCERARSIILGAFKDYCSDLLSLVFCACSVVFCAFPVLQIDLYAAAVIFVTILLLSAFLVLFKNIFVEGKADSLSVILLILTSIIGGCFGEASFNHVLFGKLAYCTPQGLFLAAIRGESHCLAILAALAVLLIAFGLYRFVFPYRRQNKRA
ncbi:MAG: ABC transporter permease [Clostridiales bacterium]|nr:ABC transporter permease [Clostridiales bacterium]